MTRDELKTLIRTEPSVQETFDAINAEYVKAKTHADSLELRLLELQLQLDAIAEAKEALVAHVAADEAAPAEAAEPAQADESEGEPAAE